MQEGDVLASQVADLVAVATEGSIARELAVENGSTFAEIGMSSLSYLRLIDAVENEFGVYIDLEDAVGRVNTVRGIVDYIMEQGVSGGA
jgi:acyl carrier protein